MNYAAMRNLRGTNDGGKRVLLWKKPEGVCTAEFVASYIGITIMIK